MVNDSIPASSGKMPILGIYIIIMLILASVACIITIFGLRHNGSSLFVVRDWCKRMYNQIRKKVQKVSPEAREEVSVHEYSEPKGGKTEIAPDAAPSTGSQARLVTTNHI